MFKVFMQGFILGMAIATLIHFWLVPSIMSRRERVKELKEIQKGLFDRSVESVQKGIVEAWLHNDKLTPEIIEEICELTTFKYSSEVSTVNEDDDYIIWIKHGKNTKQLVGSFTKPPKELARFKAEEFNKSPIL